MFNFIYNIESKYFWIHIIRKVMEKQKIIELLQLRGEDRQALLKEAATVKDTTVGRKIYLRGLVEISNICSKDCLYCGIRMSNNNVIRYSASDEEVLEACRLAWENGFGSVVLQSGEVTTPSFVSRIASLLKQIKKLSNNELGITLSCGEQTRDTFRRWFESGAHRYLLRIETSDYNLYNKIHPQTPKHSFERRIEALNLLRNEGYQLGTGVMIGLPFQTIDSLADDLLFFKHLDIDMCGMGPYIEHKHTPLYEYNSLLKPKRERLELALNMIAVLRLLMPDINIAATTALQAIDPTGREQALMSGANVLMPNLTPLKYRKEYLLYEGKPYSNSEFNMSDYTKALTELTGYKTGRNEWGDSLHFQKTKK